MWNERQRGRTGPSSFYVNIFQVVFNELADPRAPIDVWDELQQIVGRGQARLDCCNIHRMVLVTHGSGRDADGTVVERTDQCVGFGA